jgi:hypothetical protein
MEEGETGTTAETGAGRGVRGRPYITARQKRAMCSNYKVSTFRTTVHRRRQICQGRVRFLT